MRVPSQPILAYAARLYAPLALVFALSILAVRAPGDGVGVVAGMAFSLALVLHALVFGADASRRALPPALALSLLALGLIAVSASAGVPGAAMAPQLLEAGAFLTTAAALALVVIVLFGRVQALKDAGL